jgi:cell division protein FtsZ
LLEDTSMNGARGLLINITGGDDLTLFEVDQAANRIREEVDEEANIIFGSAIDESLSGRIRVSVVATGIDSPVQAENERPRLVAVGGGGMPLPLPIPLPIHAAADIAMAMPAGAGPTPAPMMHAHPLRQAAPQMYVVTDAMPETAPMMEAMPTAEPQPIPHPVAPVHNVTASMQGVGVAPQRAAPPAASRASLFAEAPQAAAAPAAPTASDAARPSLFSTVTGAIRRRMPVVTVTAPAQPTQQPRAEPVLQEPRAEQPRASVRQTGGEEVGLDIPAFLRRQSS